MYSLTFNLPAVRKLSATLENISYVIVEVPLDCICCGPNIYLIAVNTSTDPFPTLTDRLLKSFPNSHIASFAEAISSSNSF